MFDEVILVSVITDVSVESLDDSTHKRRGGGDTKEERTQNFMRKSKALAFSSQTHISNKFVR